ncbi:MAG TPA: hypothetical protein VJQ55_06145, partial [Candidatus Binatia bacterium]|nr:hypothetical protein [Candidatus Binatia bacterium]
MRNGIAGRCKILRQNRLLGSRENRVTILPFTNPFNVAGGGNQPEVRQKRRTMLAGKRSKSLA